RIIPSPAGIVQAVALRKQVDIHEGGEESVMLTQEYIRKVDADVGEEMILSVARGLAQLIVAIIKSCASNAPGDLTVTPKDLSVPGNGSGVGGSDVGGSGIGRSGVGGSGMLDEEEIIKLLEE
ncbi:hypothetical protein Tco_0290673, partial [Tanacetum coccineum]